MGMFDYVTVPEGIKCPRCGQDMGHLYWQTKCNDPPQLERVDYSTVDQFYEICSNKDCEEWVEFNRLKGNRDLVPGYEMTHYEKGTRHKVKPP